MRKLTKDQKHYRKLKKDGEKDFRYTDLVRVIDTRF